MKESGVSVLRMLMLMAVVATSLVIGRWVAEMLVSYAR